MTKKVVVIIHGAGKQPDDYPREQVEALTEELGYQPDYLAARYDDVPAGCGWRRNGDEEARMAVEGEIVRWERALRLQATLQEYVRTGRLPEVGGRVALASLPFGLASTVQDCVHYLLADKSFQDAVQARLIEPLTKAAAEYDETILVSHSLGSVVSFDVLKTHAKSFPLSTWFTTGSPLRWIIGLKLGNRTGDPGEISTGTVRFWHNLYDTTDLVANALAPAVPKYNLYDDFVEISDTFPEAHDNYWKTQEVLGIIADALR